MKLFSKTVIPGLALAAGVAMATATAANPVEERQATMQTIRQSVAVLGGMASGQAAFDAGAATTAQSALAAAAASIPDRFGEEAPGGAARADVWTNWDDFTTRAGALLAAAEALDASSLDTLQAGMGDVGGACQACHSVFRD